MRRIAAALAMPALLWAQAHIFVFHRFGDTRHPTTNTSIPTLKAEFDYLKQNGYEVVTLSRIARALQRGEAPDDRWVALTIDDGYRSFYDNALPLFKTYRYPFTLFVYTEASEKGYGDFMSWEQLAEAAKYGEIGLHGDGHLHEVSESNETLAADTARGIALIRKHLGITPRYYAYPYGEYDTRVRSLIQSFGFDLVLNQNSGAVDASSDPHNLDRIALTGKNLIQNKLRIGRFDAQWICPTKWPKDGRLKEIHAKIATTSNTAQLYVSGYGWRRVAVREGEIREKLDLPLKKRRTRLFLKVANRQNGIILVKE